MMRRRTYGNKVDSGRYQLACVGTKHLRSNDYGKTWVDINLSLYLGNFAISSNGKYQGVYGDIVAISSDYGTTWPIKRKGDYSGVPCGMSYSGQYQYFVNRSDLFRSVDYGNSWTAVRPSFEAKELSVSETGQYILSCAEYSSIGISSDYGVTWTKIPYSNNINKPSGPAISGSGKYQSIGDGSSIHYSEDYGQTWNKTYLGWNCYNTTISKSGQYQVIGSSGRIYISSDYGKTWEMKTIEGAGTNIVIAIISLDAKKIFIKHGKSIFLSEDLGNTFKAIADFSGLIASYEAVTFYCINR